MLSILFSYAELYKMARLFPDVEAIAGVVRRQLPAIDEFTGQENDAMFLAYVLRATFERGRGGPYYNIRVSLPSLAAQRHTVEAVTAAFALRKKVIEQANTLLELTHALVLNWKDRDPATGKSLAAEPSEPRSAALQQAGERGRVRELTADEVTFSLEVEEDDIPIRGNCMASGDDAADEACAKEIEQRLKNGDVWAWCNVRVTARWKDWTGQDSLGACSCESEEDFKANSDYYEDMKIAALVDLNRRISEVAAITEELKT
jgi:hypothetical protein